jgi:hypothetical protein
MILHTVAFKLKHVEGGRPKGRCVLALIILRPEGPAPKGFQNSAQGFNRVSTLGPTTQSDAP